MLTYRYAPLFPHFPHCVPVSAHFPHCVPVSILATLRARFHTRHTACLCPLSLHGTNTILFPPVPHCHVPLFPTGGPAWPYISVPSHTCMAMLLLLLWFLLCAWLRLCNLLCPHGYCLSFSAPSRACTVVRLCTRLLRSAD